MVVPLYSLKTNLSSSLECSNALNFGCVISTHLTYLDDFIKDKSSDLEKLGDS